MSWYLAVASLFLVLTGFYFYDKSRCESCYNKAVIEMSQRTIEKQKKINEKAISIPSNDRVFIGWLRDTKNVY